MFTRRGSIAEVILIEGSNEVEDRSAAPAEPADETGASEAPAAARRRCILLVEDDFLVGMEMEAGLQDAGYEVAGIATTAEEAVAIAAARRPALAVMDIRLAGRRDGVDAALDLFRSFGIRSLFASAHGDALVRARAEAARPLGWVAKPYRVETLLDAVESALRELGGQPAG
ncbi:MAG TPA: response regulator [Allosphingosinicella sp.]|jgi:DNA-binding NarL/FixJ family response regulator